MIINDKFMEIFLNIEHNDIKNNNLNNNKKKEKKDINTLILDSCKIYYFELKATLNQIECLSLQNNYIKNISFLHHLPNIYYLDLFGNHIDNYKPLIKHGTFGFLSLSPSKNYFEKKILTLNYLNVIILQIEIDDKSIYNNLITGNPNILVFNDTIIDFNKKVRIFNTVTGLRFYIHNLLSDNQDMKMLRKSNKNYNNIKNKNKDESLSLRDILLEKKLKIKHRHLKNPKCLEIINFFEEYNTNLFNIFKSNKSKFNNDILCAEERKKLLMIYKTINNISKFFCIDSQDNSKFVKLNKGYLSQRRISLSIKYPDVDIELFAYLEFPQYKEFVLSVLILYLLSIFSKDITFYLLLLMFGKTKYFHESENNKFKINKNIKSLSEINKAYLFSYYYKIYDVLFNESEEKANIENLRNIKKRLNLISITDKINDILSYEEIFIKDYNSDQNVSQKNKIIIKDFIQFLFNHKIFHEIFNIFQFVNDFLIYNKLYIQLENSFSKDIHFFCEIQGILLIYYNKYDEVKESLADKIYNKIQSNYLLGNKFYFRKSRLKGKNPFLFSMHKVFHPNKKRIEQIENIIPIHDLKKDKEKLMKQNYINNSLKQYFIIKKESGSLNKWKTIKNEININPKKEHSLNLNNNSNTFNFYKTYNTFSNFKNKIDLNRNYSKEKIKSFYDSSTLKSHSKSHSKNIKNLKNLSVLTNKIIKKNIFFNNNLLSNHFTSFNDDFKSFNSKLTEFNNKTNSRYNSKQKNILSSFNEDIKNEKELKQFSLTIDKKIKTKYYSIKEFKKGNITSKYYNKNNHKFEDIKNNLETSNSDKYKRTPKFSDYYF